MTEAEYIAVTDLARIRAAQDLLAGAALEDLIGPQDTMALHRKLRYATEQLEIIVQNAMNDE